MPSAGGVFVRVAILLVGVLGEFVFEGGCFEEEFAAGGGGAGEVFLCFYTLHALVE